MSVHIDIDACNGCPKRFEGFCEEICPGDLFYREDGKAVQGTFRHKGHVGQSADNDEGRRFPDRPRQRQDHTRQDAREGNRKDLGANRLPPGRPQSKARSESMERGLAAPTRFPLHPFLA